MESACIAESSGTADPQSSTAETFTSHNVPPCFLGGNFLLFTEGTTGHSFLSWQLSCLLLVQCQQKLELLPPPSCMDDHDGPRDVTDLFWTLIFFLFYFC